MELGTHGVISVVANAIPNQIASICNLALNKDFVKAHEINKIYDDLYELCFANNSSDSQHSALKRDPFKGSQ